MHSQEATRCFVNEKYTHCSSRWSNSIYGLVRGPTAISLYSMTVYDGKFEGSMGNMVQAMTPARPKWSVSRDSTALAFTDLYSRGFQGPAALARPLATISPSVAGSQSAVSRQRSTTGGIFDIGSCALLLLPHLLLRFCPHPCGTVHCAASLSHKKKSCN
jgi:hypothetical protein